MTSKETTVADFVAASPSAVEALEEAGIDYCCGGDSTLVSACRRAGTSVEALLSRIDELRAAAPSSPGPGAWEQRSLRELSEYVVAHHHRYTRESNAEISALFAKVLPAHQDKYPELSRIQQVFARLERELALHMNKEEMMLFPAIVRVEQEARGDEPAPLGPGHMRYPIHELIEDHDAAGEMLREIRRESHDFTPPEHACASFHRLYQRLQGLQRDLHWHVYLENSVLFPRALVLENSLHPVELRP